MPASAPRVDVATPPFTFRIRRPRSSPAPLRIISHGALLYFYFNFFFPREMLFYHFAFLVHSSAQQFSFYSENISERTLRSRPEIKIITRTLCDIIVFCNFRVSERQNSPKCQF